MTAPTPAVAAARVRLDSYLWAARFFKTRSLAKAAVLGGKVRCNGVGTKPAKAVGIGDEVTVARGDEVLTVVVTAVAERRGSAAAAAALYAETSASAAGREASRAERAQRRTGMRPPPSRPDKRGRRRLRTVKEQAALAPSAGDGFGPSSPAT